MYSGALLLCITANILIPLFPFPVKFMCTPVLRFPAGGSIQQRENKIETWCVTCLGGSYLGLAGRLILYGLTFTQLLLLMRNTSQGDDRWGPEAPAEKAEVLVSLGQEVALQKRTEGLIFY